MIQSECLGDPWRIVVATLLVIRTTHKVSHPIITAFFSDFPTALSVVNEGETALASRFKSLGFQNKRARQVIEASKLFVQRPRHISPGEIKGLGRYGHDVWRVFVEGDLSVKTKDKALSRHVEEAIANAHGL